MSRALWAVAALVGVGLYVSKKLDGAGSQTAAGTGPQLDPNFQADTQQVVINAPQQQLLPEGVSNIPQGEPSDWDRLTRIDQATLAEGGQLEDPASFVKRLNELMLTLAGEGPSRIWMPGK